MSMPATLTTRVRTGGRDADIVARRDDTASDAHGPWWWETLDRNATTLASAGQYRTVHQAVVAARLWLATGELSPHPPADHPPVWWTTLSTRHGSYRVVLWHPRISDSERWELANAGHDTEEHDTDHLDGGWGWAVHTDPAHPPAIVGGHCANVRSAKQSAMAWIARHHRNGDTPWQTPWQER